MIQRREDACLTLESRHAVGIVTERFGQELDGDTAAQLGVGGLIHITHAAAAEVGCNRELCESSSNHSVNEVRPQILSEPPNPPTLH